MQVDINRISRRASNTLVRFRHAVVHNKAVGGAVGLWIMGLLIAFVLPAPVSVTPEAFALYTKKAQQAESQSGVLSRAQSDMYQQQAILQSEQVRHPIIGINVDAMDGARGSFHARFVSNASRGQQMAPPVATAWMQCAQLDTMCCWNLHCASLWR